MSYVSYVGHGASTSFSHGGVESCSTRYVEAKIGEEYDAEENEDAECHTLSYKQSQ